MEQVQLLSGVGLTNDDSTVRSNVMAVLGRLGRQALKKKDDGAEVLQVSDFSMHAHVHVARKSHLKQKPQLLLIFQCKVQLLNPQN